MSLNEHFKDAGAEKYGEPPYGHAELSSLQTFTKKMKLDLAKSMELVVRELKKQGIEASEELTLKKIAANNNTGPHDIYEHIKSLVQN